MAPATHGRRQHISYCLFETKETLAYVLLVVIATTLTGKLFGAIVGP